MGFEKLSKKELINFVETLLKRVDVLEAKVESLNLKVAELQEENQILKVKKNSSNSSIAPSSDISKPNQSLREKSKLTKGGQAGHKGRLRSNLRNEIPAIKVKDANPRPSGPSDGIDRQIAVNEIDDPHRGVGVTDAQTIGTGSQRREVAAEHVQRTSPLLGDDHVRSAIVVVKIAVFVGELGEDASM